MSDQFNPSPPSPEQQLTKRQRRELRRQEQEAARQAGVRRRSTARWVVWVIVIVVIGGGVWALASAGSSGNSSGGLDLMKQDTTDPYLGSATAAVVVREFSDFQCPACKAAQPLVAKLKEEFGDSIKFEYNDFPLIAIHENSLVAAEAGQCALDQEKFWAFHDRMFERQGEWEDLSNNDAKERFKAYAGDLGMDAARFASCLDSRQMKDRVQQDINQGNAAKVSATPTFFVNDEQITGVPDFEDLKALIEREKAGAGAANTDAS